MMTIESSTLPSKPTTITNEADAQGSDQNKADSSWPFRSQSADRSLIRRSMHLYLESAHNANQGNLFSFVYKHYPCIRQCETSYIGC